MEVITSLLKKVTIAILRKCLKLLNDNQKNVVMTLLLSLLQESQSQKTDNHIDQHGNFPYPSTLVEFEKLYDSETGGWHVPPSSVKINIFDKKLYPTIFYDSVEREVGHLYYTIVKLLKPRKVLETGVSRGYSTTCVASALFENNQQGHIYAIDPADYPHIWPDYLEPYITWLHKRSQDALEDVNSRKYELIIIDSLHDYRTCAWEVIHFEPLLVVGGIMLLHDSLCFDGVGAVVGQIMQNPRFELVTLNTPRNHGELKSRCPGLTIVRKLKAGAPFLIYEEKFDAWFTGDTLSKPYLNALQELG